jgi:hypothetical protein
MSKLLQLLRTPIVKSPVIRWLIYTLVSLFAFYKLSLYATDPPELTNLVSAHNSSIIADDMITISRITWRRQRRPSV